MSTNNQGNINISSINVLKNINDSLGNISINNSIKIPYTSINNTLSETVSNACIFIKDINNSVSSSYYSLKVNSSEKIVPYMYFNDNLVIDTSNLLSELEHILENYVLDVSNINVSGRYINFYNNDNHNDNNNDNNSSNQSNIFNQGEHGVGLRYSVNNTVQFKNYNTNWIDLVDITRHNEFKELHDIDVSSNPLLHNQYITYNTSSNLFVNSNLSIIHDKNPTLSNNLYAGTHSIMFSNNTNNIIYNNSIIQNPYISLINNTTETGICNYIEFSNSDTNVDPLIQCNGSDKDI